MTAIRLIGDHHTSHRDGAVLTVTDNQALAAHSPEAVTLRHAYDLVARGDAEWVGPEPLSEGAAARPEDEGDAGAGDWDAGGDRGPSGEA